MAWHHDVPRVVCSHATAVILGCMVTSLVGTTDFVYADCPVPDQYPHSTSLTVGDLLFRVATDRSAYVIGQTVQMFLSVENIGSNPVVIPNPCGCSPLQAFGIFPEACPTPLPSACMPPPYWAPVAHFDFGTPITVSPGQCLTFTKAWNGTPVFGGTVTPGAYVFAAGTSPEVGTFYLPESGVRLAIRIDENVPTLRGTWGRLKVIYR